MNFMYIDGANLETELRELQQKLSVDSLPFSHRELSRRFGATRCFYYDAYPAKKETETEGEFEFRWNEKKAFFAHLNRIPNFHVRTGTSRYSAKKGQKQKGIDVLLAVDAITAALNGITSSATLVVSDLDYFPVLQALLQSRVSTHLICFPKKTSEELIEAADVVTALTRSTLLECCGENFAKSYWPTGIQANDVALSGDFVSGQYEDIEIKVGRTPDGQYVGCFNGDCLRSQLKELIFERFGMDGLRKIQFSDSTSYP